MINILSNTLKNPVLFLVTNLVWVVLTSCCFYSEGASKQIIRFCRIIVILVSTKLIGLSGTCFASLLLHTLDIVPEIKEICQSIQIAFSNIVLLFFYFVLFKRIGNKNLIRTKKQYIYYFVTCLYSFWSVLATAKIATHESQELINILMGSILFTNMYLLCFIKLSDERNYFRLKTEMVTQQVNLQYADYEVQRERNVAAMAILHDVDKHLTMVEQLYSQGRKTEALDYTEQMNQVLRPYMPIQYTTNPVLNCLLSEKYSITEKLEIEFHISVLAANINFMKAIDITTLFGNLIDNAITACTKCDVKRYISLNIDEYNEIIAIRIENSISEPVMVKNGKIVERRRETHGIGLLNIKQCVEKYEGSIIYKSTDHSLVCDIILNR